MEQETKAPVIDWKANYDVVVLGFGGAGATAARFAADNGTKVLIADVALTVMKVGTLGILPNFLGLELTMTS